MGLLTGEENIILQEYSKNPVCNYKLDNYTIKYHEGNFICGDDITVYLLIDDNIVKDYSYDGDTSTVSLAAAGFLSEFLVGASIDDVLSWGYNILVKEGFGVSRRRQRAAILALLAVRNAIHEYLDDGQIDDFDDLLSD